MAFEQLTKSELRSYFHNVGSAKIRHVGGFYLIKCNDGEIRVLTQPQFVQMQRIQSDLEERRRTRLEKRRIALKRLKVIETFEDPPDQIIQEIKKLTEFLERTQK